MARYIGPSSSSLPRYGYFPGPFALKMASDLKMLNPSTAPAPPVTVDIPPRPMPGRKIQPSLHPGGNLHPHR